MENLNPPTTPKAHTPPTTPPPVIKKDCNIEDEAQKRRHGCVTTWLYFMIVSNVAAILKNLFNLDKMMEIYQTSSAPFVALITLALANIAFAILLLKWKKIGFWGFLVTSIMAAIFNVALGMSVVLSAIGLSGVIILYALLQIKQNNISSWRQME